MYEFLIMAIVLPTIIASIFLGNLAFHDFLLKYELGWVTYPVSAAVYLIQEYFILKFSLATLGYVYFQYMIAMTVFFMGRKHFGTILLALTPLTIVIFLYAEQLIKFNVIANFVLETFILFILCYVTKALTRSYLGFALTFITLTLLAPVIEWSLYGLETEIDFSTLAWLGLGTFTLLLFDNLYHQYMQSQENKYAQIEYSSTHDGLTDLLNYTAFHEHLEQQKHFPTICALDLDHFKQINDTYGHLEGNEALRYFANFLRENCRRYFGQSCKIYRFGGEEFCVLIEEEVLQTCWEFFNELETKLQQTPFMTEDKQAIKLSFSCGIAHATATHAVQEALHQADMALYNAKKQGRGRICLATPL